MPEERRKQPNIYSVDNYAMLIRLETKLDYLTNEVKEIRDSATKRADSLEMSKFDSKDFAETWGKQIVDHEVRLRNVERYLWMGLGVLGLLNFLGFGYIISIIK